ncbi:sensor domain-containing diguanylate cyclase [Hahella ganghwensis]|uniref:sensor domain-containing diguanylate cyclase n=1 Tax=Hahella ganghwensis TaxID=286420 RepID=UPI0003644A42|nr:diguanylate cyclase [Hahella ganghwensis]
MNKKLEEENQKLTRQVQSLKETLDHIGAYVFMKDSEGCYTFANKLVCELFEHSLDEIVGQDDSKFFALDISDDLKQNDRVVLEQGKTIENVERNIIASTGETRYYMAVKKPLKDKDGNIIGMYGVSTDITERKQMELEIRRKNELLNSILSNLDAFVYMKDKDYRFLYVNEKTAALFGKDPADIIGKTDEEAVSEAGNSEFREMDEKLFLTGEKQEGEETLELANGDVRYYWSTKIPLKDEQGAVSSFIGFSTDITELSLLRNRLEQQVQEEIIKRLKHERLAITDPLTGIYNRLKLDEVLEQEWQRAKRSSQTFGIILLDVDYFKHVNDTCGHQTGDKTLIEIARLLKNNVREIDTVGRWGGEEFLIVCPDTDREGTTHLAEKLRTVIEQHKFPVVTHKTASFGVTTYKDGDTINEMVSRADVALYKAKGSGRNQVEASGK